MDFALFFAQQILRTSKEQVTHLKLQKLAFYCYGAARAHDELSEGQRIVFERWPHGPVSPVIYERFKSYRAQVLPQPEEGPCLTGAAWAAFQVYQWLSPWQLREESHLEAPWLQAKEQAELDDQLIHKHFREKFRASRVQAPVNLPGAWSLALDGLPQLSGSSLQELAELLKHEP